MRHDARFVQCLRDFLPSRTLLLTRRAILLGSSIVLAATLLLIPSQAFGAVSVTVSPSAINLPPSGTQQFTAIVTGSSDTSVVWSVQEGNSGGTITPAGLYSAPSVDGMYHVIATSHADGSQSATATVVVPGFVVSGLSNPRAGHTATLLPDGRILFVGGAITPGVTASDSAEIYDPTTLRSTPTANPIVSRGAHTATLLPNGKVLLAGGQTFSGQTATAELYDPITGTFTATGSMSVARVGHSATLLPNGKVLIAGGGNCNSGCVYFKTAELYDPNTGTFSSTGNLVVPSVYHAATLLPTGKVLIAGGSPDGTNSNSVGELYDPATGLFAQSGVMVNPRQFFTATLLQNGKVLFAGGLVGGAVTSSAEIYDPSIGTFTSTGGLNIPRDLPTATLLLSGNVLITGGNSTLSRPAGAELYNPETGTFSMTGNMEEPRFDHTATALPNGKVILAGGTSGQILGSIETYDQTAGVFSSQSVFMNVARTGHAMARLSDGRLLFVGGLDGAGIPTSSAEIYDPSTGRFSLTGSLAQARFGHTATLLGTGKVLVVGGYSDTPMDSIAPAAELYDPVSATFGPASSPGVARANHTATMLPNGKVLFAGGQVPTGGPTHTMPTSSAELYDPGAGTFLPAGNMSAPRYNHTATLLNDGRVLLAEGVSGPLISTGQVALDDLYDPSTSTFTPLGPMVPLESAPVNPFDSILLANGQVLVDNQTIFDPVSNTLSFFNAHDAQEIENYEFTSVPNSEVFVTGGGNGRPGPFATYLFDPTSLTYALAGNAEYNRMSPTSVLLPNGEVLIAGGADVAQVEFYVAPVAAPGPEITGVSPNPLTGFTAVPITIQGANFAAGSVVWLNGSITPANIVSNTEITTTVPPQILAIPGNYTILIENVNGVYSAPFTFTVNNPQFWTNTPSGSSVAFGSIPVQTIASQFVPIENIGNEPLALGSISISGTNSADFTFDTTNTTCPLSSGTIQPSTTCHIYINFTPQAGGARSATLTVAYSTPPGGPFVLNLSGSGIDNPAISVTTGPLSFGNQVVGTPSTPQTLSVSNTGTVGLSNLSISLSDTADYSLSTTCSAALAPGASCPIAITFDPAAAGNVPGTITISANDPGSPHTIQLTGTGTNFVISPVSGSSTATVTAGQPATYQLSLSPQVYSGTVNLTCTEVTTIPNTTCIISPNPASISGNTPITITITVATTARSAAAAPWFIPNFPYPFPGLRQHENGASQWFLCLMMSLVLLAAARKTRRKIRVAISAAFLFLLLANGCGTMGNTGGGSGITPPTGSTGTPAGTYQLLVTASSSGVTRTTTLSLTVM